MKKTKHTSAFFAAVAFLGVLLYLIDSTGLITLKISSAHPIMLIPLLVSISMAAREWTGLLFGAFFGVLLDITGAGTYCFNLLTFMLIGCVCGLLCSYFVNENIYSAIMLTLLSAAAYFAARWFIFFVLKGHGFSGIYLLSFALPSLIYTTVFIFPFYYLIKFISKKTHYTV